MPRKGQDIPKTRWSNPAWLERGHIEPARGTHPPTQRPRFTSFAQDIIDYL